MIASSIILQDSAGAISLQMSLALWLHTYCCLWRLYKRIPTGSKVGIRVSNFNNIMRCAASLFLWICLAVRD